LCLSGYQPEDLVLHPHFNDHIKLAIQDIEKQVSGPCGVIIGAPVDGYNCAILIHDGKTQSVLQKYDLPNYGVFDEKRVFKSGDLPDIVEFQGHKLGIGICEDFWFPTVANHLKFRGAGILISINGSPFDMTKDETRKLIARKRVEEASLPFIYVNQVGGQDDLVYDGGSFTMNANGDLVHQCPFFEEGIKTIYHSELISESKTNDTLKQVQDDANQKIYSALKLGLHDYINKNDFPGVVIGLSGGMDSALSAVIAVDALGADRVHGVMMPSPYTSQESLDDAEELAKNLGVQYDIMPIEPAMDAYDKILSNPDGVTAENIQSRARGMILMALSNRDGKMVLTTGNKSEMAVGYATLYGDMCGGFNCLKDVYKTQVYELSRWRNDQSYVIPDNIITRAPSAELRPDQVDQDSLPPYDILDAVLERLIEQRQSISEVVADGFDEEVVKRVYQMLTRNEYKRRQSAPGTKITPLAFGRDRRMPIVNKWKA
jgi:NAD+ synthase